MAALLRQLQAQKYLESQRVTPISQSLRNSKEPVKATLERGWAGIREVSISANLAQEQPEEVGFDFLDAIVRLGCESLLHDADERLCADKNKHQMWTAW